MNPCRPVSLSSMLVVKPIPTSPWAQSKELPLAMYSMQGMQPMRRAVRQHVEREDTAWADAFSLSTEIAQLFLRQATRDDTPDQPADYPGIGFYVTVDDGSLSLDDVRCESGFRQQIESHATFELQGDTQSEGTMVYVPAMSVHMWTG